MDANHLPVAGGGVFAGRAERAAAVSAFRVFGFGKLGDWLKVAESEATKIRDFEPSLACDVAERVAASIAVIGGVGHFTHADAVENNPDDALERQDSI